MAGPTLWLPWPTGARAPWVALIEGPHPTFGLSRIWVEPSKNVEIGSFVPFQLNQDGYYEIAVFFGVHETRMVGRAHGDQFLPMTPAEWAGLVLGMQNLPLVTCVRAWADGQLGIGDRFMFQGRCAVVTQVINRIAHNDFDHRCTEVVAAVFDSSLLSR